MLVITDGCSHLIIFHRKGSLHIGSSCFENTTLSPRKRQLVVASTISQYLDGSCRCGLFQSKISRLFPIISFFLLVFVLWEEHSVAKALRFKTGTVYCGSMNKLPMNYYYAMYTFIERIPSFHIYNSICIIAHIV